MLKGLAGLAVVQKAAQGIAETFMGSFNGFANFEQLQGGVETLFGAGGKSVEEYAKSVGKSVSEVQGEYDRLIQAQDTVFKDASSAYKDAGMSANQYMEQLTSFSASLTQSLGGDTLKAAEYGKMAMVDMSDNANKMGTNMESIQNAYQGFAKQNYTMLDNLKLGYGGTKAEMERLLEDAEKLTGKDFDISSYADIIEAIHAIQEEMGITGTTMEEAETTIEGSLNRLSATWSNWLVGLADENADLDELTNELVESIIIVGRNVLPRIAQIIKSLFSQIPQAIMDALNEQFGSMAITIPGIDFTALQEAISPVVDAFGNLKQVVVDAASGIWERLQPAFVELAPYVSELALALLPALSGALQWLAGVLDIVFTAFQVLWDILAPIVLPDLERHLEAISTGLTILGGYLDWIGTQFQTASDTARGAWENAKSFFSALPGEIIGFFSGIGSGIGAFFDDAVNWAQSAFQSLVDFVSGIPGQIVGYFAGLGDQITSAIGSIHFPQPQIDFDSVEVGGIGIPIPRVTWAASGGIFAPNAPTLLGLGDNRRYDEAAIPLSPSVLAGIGAGIAQHSGGIGGGVNVYINNAQVNSDEEISNSVYNILSVLQRRGRM